jgi:flagellar motor switch protein FliG
VAGVLRDLPEEVLLSALKLGQAQESTTVAFILENLPRRLSERYLEELAALEDVSRKEGEAAQIEITKVIQAQAREGQIRFIEKDAGAG